MIGLLVGSSFDSRAYAHGSGTTITLVQDSTGRTSPTQKQGEKKKKEAQASAPQKVKQTVQKVPKAKNKAVPKAIPKVKGPTSVRVKTPQVKTIKVKVKTQVKIKL